ncbi:hypothetical protein [Orenia metallireducens]|nr:hypothetical protein [Orenia metallireducens]
MSFFDSLFLSVRTFGDFLKILLTYFLIIMAILIFLKVFELIASFMGAGKIYDSMFKKKDKDSNQNK